MRKGQVTVEFIVITAFMLLLFSTVFFTLQNRVIAVRNAQNFETLRQLGNVVAVNVRLAVQVGEGYERDFIIPQTLNGEKYNITINDGWDLIVTYEDLRYIQFLELPIQGNVSKGLNHIECCNYSYPDGITRVMIS